MGFRNQLQYSSCSEDLQSEISVVKMLPQANVVSVAGGGGRALGLLTATGRPITAIDFNPTQVEFTQWKMRVIQRLDYEDFACLMGLTTSRKERKNVFAKVAAESKNLSLRVRWRALRHGALFSGRVEEHFTFGGKLLNKLYPSQMERLLKSNDPSERVKTWDELTTRGLWSRLVQLGSSPWLYRYVLQNSGWYNDLPDGLNVPTFVLGRIRDHLAKFSVLQSHVLQLVLFGRYFPDLGATLPHYLRPENYQTIRSRLENITPVCGDLVGHFAEQKFSQPIIASISNVPAYLPRSAFLELWRAISVNTAPRSLIVGRHFLRKLQIPANVANHFELLGRESKELSETDLSFIYDLFLYRRN